MEQRGRERRKEGEKDEKTRIARRVKEGRDGTEKEGSVEENREGKGFYFVLCINKSQFIHQVFRTMNIFCQRNKFRFPG